MWKRIKLFFSSFKFKKMEHQNSDIPQNAVTPSVEETQKPILKYEAGTSFKDFAEQVAEAFKKDLQKIEDEQDKPIKFNVSGSSFSIR